MMAEAWDEGGLHWQIGESGKLILGVRSPAGSKANGIGFEGLSDLPSKLTEPVGPSGRPRLLSLFQPTAAARPAFQILLMNCSPRAMEQPDPGC